MMNWKTSQNNEYKKGIGEQKTKIGRGLRHVRDA